MPIGPAGRPQSFNYEPKTQCNIKESHWRIEPPQVNHLVEVGENVENQCTRHAKCRRNHAEGSQCSRDIAGLEPQVAAGRGCQCSEQQANIIIVKTRAEIEARQGLQSLCVKCLQIISASEEPQSIKEIKRHNEPH